MVAFKNPKIGILILLRFIPFSTQLTTPTDISNKPNTKQVLLVFGHGNVAKSVIKYATQIENIDIRQTNQERNHGDTKVKGEDQDEDSDDDRLLYFDSIICTYNKTPPSPLQLRYSSKVTYIPFQEDAIVNIMKKYPVSHVISTIPPQPYSEVKGSYPNSTLQSYRDVVLDSKIKDFLPEKSILAFVSTTGVYGNHHGEWVNELSETKCKPDTKAHAYLDIENQWNNLNRQTDSGEHKRKGRVCIFRCSGLYGNDFSALHTVRKNGWEMNYNDLSSPTMMNDGSETRVSIDKLSITSRVHLDDVGRAILAYMMKEDVNNDNKGMNDIYNLSDDMPASRNEVMQFAHELLEKENLHISNDQLNGNKSSERRSRRSQDRKRVSNVSMRWLLSPYGGLKHPSFREGLNDVLNQNKLKWRDNKNMQD